ncbi:MAG: AAA family ATPase [Prevotella sp.]|nr:AAA family ATPase [Prevotella sp.]
MLFSKNEYIGPYKVTFPHKQGLYAETYRVKDASGKTLFLKLINYNKLNRYQTDEAGHVIEVEVARLLDHPNLCWLVDTGTLTINGGQHAYMVKEYISGETLSEHVTREGRPEVYKIKQAARAVLSALSFLHTLPNPIIHNEVTIQNIMLNLTGNISDLKLIDFGHACFLGGHPGKPDLRDLNAFYLAPERFAGTCSVQSDLYSVGVLIYQLLYGELPWYVDLSRASEADKADMVLAEREKDLYIPKVNIFELDEQLVNTFVKALSQEASDRFQTAEEFIQAIDGQIKVERQSTRKKFLSQQDKPKSVKTSRPKGEGFAAVAGMNELKEQLREEVIEPLHNPEEYRRYGVSIPNGMLLYGPPGCGKTFFAKHFAEEVGFNFMLVTPATLKSKYVNATQENIAAMFKAAEENAPTIIFIDEMNELVPNRESDVHEMSRSAVNEMLAQMDCTGERNIFIIGATNYPNMIDPAILRAGRLDKKYYVGVPDLEARKSLFELYLKDRPYDFGLDYDELARLTADYVSADIQLIVNDAARNALRRHCKITMELLKAAIAACRPSIDKKTLERFEKIRLQMEGKEPAGRPKIGF